MPRVHNLDDVRMCDRNGVRHVQVWEIVRWRGVKDVLQDFDMIRAVRTFP